LEGLDPGFKLTPSGALLEKADSLVDFTDGQNADEKFFLVEGRHGLANPGVPLRVTQF
jgi:hypothetical protein